MYSAVQMTFLTLLQQMDGCIPMDESEMDGRGIAEGKRLPLPPGEFGRKRSVAPGHYLENEMWFAI